MSYSTAFHLSTVAIKLVYQPGFLFISAYKFITAYYPAYEAFDIRIYLVTDVLSLGSKLHIRCKGRGLHPRYHTFLVAKACHIKVVVEGIT